MLKWYPSLREALQTLYPEHSWQPSEFLKNSKKKMPDGYWSDRQNQREIIERIGRELGVNEVPPSFFLSFAVFLLLTKSSSCRIGTRSHVIRSSRRVVVNSLPTILRSTGRCRRCIPTITGSQSGSCRMAESVLVIGPIRIR